MQENPPSISPGEDDGEDREPPKSPPSPPEGVPEDSLFGVGDPIDAKKVDRTGRRDRRPRQKISGRRIKTFSEGNAGTYVSSRFPTGNGDIALDATIRAAAPYQAMREKDGMAIAIRDPDIRERVRVGRVSTACIFVVDASGSMGAKKRMECAKGAVLSLLLDSYQNRDRVGLVAFGGRDADLLLPLCSSVDLALKRLEEMPTGGKTPLSRGLMKGMETLVQEQRKNGETIPMMVLISDGRANVPVGGDVRKELTALAEEIRSKGIHMVVIDTEEVKRSYLRMQLGYCREIADLSGGAYYPIGNLSPGEISEIAYHERASIPLF